MKQLFRIRGAVLPSLLTAVVLTSALVFHVDAQPEEGVVRKLSVFTPFRDEDAMLLRKQTQDISALFNSNAVAVDYHVSTTTDQQRDFLQEHSCVEGALDRFLALRRANQTQLAQELWKYCALYTNGGMYLDSGTALLRAAALEQLLARSNSNNAAVLMDSFAPKAVHGSFLFVKEPKSKVALEMAQFLVDTPISTLLESSPLLIPQTLYQRIVAQQQQQQQNNDNNKKELLLTNGQNGDWYMLHQSCSVNPFRSSHYYLSLQQQEQPTNKHYNNNLHQCPRDSGFCCFIYSTQEQQAILASKHPVLPEYEISYEMLPKPMIHQASSTTTTNYDNDVQELPFISTLKRTDQGRRELAPESSSEQTAEDHVPTFYEQMKAKDCMPSANCRKCMGDKKHGATCETCLDVCPCFCRALCTEYLSDKNSKTANATFHDIVVTKPKHARDPTRLIPRIVHQTWFEDLTKEKYPNMSRMTQSFRTSGWEYNFYTDDQAGSFLDQHFPPQVREAYDSLIPGAFKADLFRYCVLLIRGGVYADVDTMVGPSLDDAIPGDVGFMVPLDEPGKKVGTRMCLWNGFIAASPGHPFLAKAIETIVNNIRRRYTSIDMAQMHCPAPELSVITSFSPLFVAGPCMLGGTINRVLGRHGQTSFEAGEVNHTNTDVDIPGRTIILNQNKWDMGAHRFTFEEQNLIVLSTDFPDSDDREKLDDSPEHYSKTRVKFEIYGIDNVYKDKHRSTDGLLRIQVQ